MSQTPSPLSSVLSAYRGTGPVITGLKCVYGPSQLAAFSFYFATHQIDLAPAFTPEPNLTIHCKILALKKKNLVLRGLLRFYVVWICADSSSMQNGLL